MELREESVEAVDFLALFHKGVVLGNTAQSKFVHEVDLEGVFHVLIRESLDSNWECSTEEHDLASLWVELKELLNDRCEFGRKKFIGFVHNESVTVAEIGNTFSCKIKDSSRSTHDDVDRFL